MMTEKQRQYVLTELRFYPPIAHKKIYNTYCFLLGEQDFDEIEQKYTKEINIAQRYRIDSDKSPVKAIEQFVKDNPKYDLEDFNKYLS